MKKKIKDLTLEEKENFCKKFKSNYGCLCCPIYISCHYGINSEEREVEVDEEV